MKVGTYIPPGSPLPVKARKQLGHVPFVTHFK